MVSKNNRKPSQRPAASAAKSTPASKSGANDLVPTEAELAEAAASKTANDPDDARQAVIDARTKETPPRPSPKSGTWFGCAMDKDDNAMVTEEPYSDQMKARDAAVATLPNSPSHEVAVQAADRDTALAAYEALSKQERFDALEIAMAVTAESSGPRASLFETRTQQVDHSELLVSPTGIAHVSDDCRFTRGKTDMTKVPDPDGEVLAYLIKNDVAQYTGDEDDAKPVRMTGYCVYCTVQAPAPELAGASA